MESNLPLVLLAASVGTVFALLAAAWLSFKSLSKALEPMVSLSTGVLLGTSLLHLLPEAMDRGMPYHDLFRWLLAGLLIFFVLEKFALLRHSHHHEHDGHDHHHGFDRHEAGRGGVLILVGDSIHNFADGMLIASAFLIDVQLGLLTTAAIALHEIPQQTGDFLVLINAGIRRKKAFILMAFTGTAAILGALLGYTVLKEATEFLPYALVIAASSFLYVAVADLIPHMQQRLALKEGFSQLFFVSLGIVLVSWLSTILHNHPH